MSRAIPTRHLWMPDGKIAVCAHFSNAEKARIPEPEHCTWIHAHANCRSCLARCRATPQLANAIQAARQVTIDEVAARTA